MLARVAATTALLAATAGAQDVLFFDDFESGFTHWTPSSAHWHVALDTEPCYAEIVPFPSGSQAARYGNMPGCDFSGQTQPRHLDLNVGVDLPASAGSAYLIFDSYEAAECVSCGWDRRFVYVSVDGGPWTFLEESTGFFEWYRPVMDLTPYLGSSVRIRFEFDPVDEVWNHFLGWVIDDVRIVATDPPTTYCTGKTNSLGCVPFLTTTGTASVTSTTPFRIVANDSVNDVGRVWYAFKKSNLNFHGGKLCIKSPLQRLTNKSPKQTGTPPCEWSLSRDFNARIQSGLDPQLTPGQTVFAQWRGRDASDPQGFGDQITNAVRFVIAP